MMRLIRWIACLGLLLIAVAQAGAFSPLGPLKNDASGIAIPWQGDGFGGRPQGLGYDLNFDIGGPMTPMEAYRWTIPVVTYAFDSTFLRYFGTNGVAAVEEAIKIFNDLPKASAMSPTLTEFPLDAKGHNFNAGELRLLDLKSHALGLLIEQLGLANPERFVWGLRDRVERTVGNTTFTNYSVIQMNYDPVTIQPSVYVNGVLYNYRIIDNLGPGGAEWASAVEWYQLDPLYFAYSSVAGGSFNSDAVLGSTPEQRIFIDFGLATGEFYRGLTRDDVGGLRFLLSTNNMVVESLLPDIVGGTAVLSGGSPWAPFPGATNAGGTNTPVPTPTNAAASTLTRVGLRQGIDKVTFQRVNFDSLLGSTFIPITNRYNDRFLNPTNGRFVTQRVQRVIQQPDLIFAVGDLGTDPVSALPFIATRSDTSGWSNNVALNASPLVVDLLNLGGPGVITPGAFVIFSDLIPYFANTAPGDQDVDGFQSGIWGTFDGTARPPVVYPIFQHPLLPDLSLQYLQNLALQRNRN